MAVASAVALAVCTTVALGTCAAGTPLVAWFEAALSGLPQPERQISANTPIAIVRTRITFPLQVFQYVCDVSCA
jgi:hypothetical protein